MKQNPPFKRVSLLLSIASAGLVVAELPSHAANGPTTIPTTVPALPTVWPTTLPGGVQPLIGAYPGSTPITTQPASIPGVVISPAPVLVSMPDPRFAGWAKFKAGSTVTLAGDMTVQGVPARMTIVQTLTEATADAVKVEDKIGVSVLGGNYDSPPQTETITAKSTVMAGKEPGTRDVVIGSKTYTCTVLEMSDNGGQPTEQKRTVYLSDTVPGGVVEMDVTDAAGKTISLKMTGSDVK